MQLKPINQQVAIIGTSSDIGRETALQFAKKGAKLIVALGVIALSALANPLTSAGGK